MKKILIYIVCILIISSCKTRSDNQGAKERNLVVYTGEPFMSQSLWTGFEYFEARYDCNVVIENFSDGWEVLKRIKSEGDSSQVDVICNINSALVNEALETGLFKTYKSDKLKFVDRKFCFDKSNHFTPYAYGYLGFLYDSERIKEPPRNYGELQDNQWDDCIIMPDPITTAIGRAFLYQTAAQFGRNGFRYLWKGISENIRIFCKSYDDAYKRLLAEEGCMLPAYTSMPVFHQETSQTNRYRVIVFEEGSYIDTENVGIMSSSNKSGLAQRFVDYLLSTEFQKRIALNKWMYPVNRNVKIGEEFADIEEVTADRESKLSYFLVKKEENIWLKKIEKTLGR